MYIKFNSKTIAFTISDCCCQVNIRLFFLMNQSDGCCCLISNPFVYGSLNASGTIEYISYHRNISFYV